MSLTLLELPAAGSLDGPAPEPYTSEPSRAGVGVTGGGIVAVVHPSRGLRSLWRGSRQISDAIGLELDHQPLPDADDFTARSGSWRREISNASTAGVLEVGMLPDTGPFPVLQWTLADTAAAPRTLTVSLKLPGNRSSPARRNLTLRPGRPATLLLLPPDVDPDRARTLVQPLPARASQRAARGSDPDSTGPRISLNGVPLADVRESGSVLNDASLTMDATGIPTGPFLSGIFDGQPQFLSGAPLVEVGWAALATGRHELARSLLRALRSEGREALPLASRLAADLLEWTGRPEVPRSSLIQLKPGPTSRHALRDTHGVREAHGILRQLETLRTWIEDRLGVRPDAEVGRLGLAPRWEAVWSRLEVQNLRMGDASVSLDCHREGDTFTFVVRQRLGRIPIHAVFEPHLPVRSVDRMLIGEDTADVQVEVESEGTRVRCQFPLDPERRVTIVGR